MRRSFFYFVCFCLSVTIFNGYITHAEAAPDIKATNAFPLSGTTFYTTDTITFSGAVENITSEFIPEAGFADVQIDWDSDTSYTAWNANLASNTSMMGSLSSNGVKPLEKGISNPPVGNHRYRFHVDTDDQLDETDDVTNNLSAWVSFVVAVAPVAPTIELYTSSNPITVGNSTTLIWTVTDATSCDATGGMSSPSDWSNMSSASLVSGGSKSIAPSVTKVYTLSCTGPGGSATKSFTVDVVTPAPTITFTASPNPINVGSQTTLDWSTTYADSCTASGGWSGSKNLDDNANLSPTTTTTYILTCYGAGGTTTNSQTVTVNGALPVITITASPLSVVSGATTTVTWSVTNATFCIGSNGGGTFPTVNGWNTSKNPVSGSFQVSSVISRAYVLNCSNAIAGTSTNQVTVTTTGLPNLTTVAWTFGQRINTSIASSSANPLTVNQANTLRAQVRNIGSATTGIGFENKFSGTWGWNQPITIGYTSSGALDAGQINTPYDETAFTPTRAGHIEIGFCADSHSIVPTSRIAETEESSTSNCTWRQFSVASSGPGFPTMNFTVPGGAVTASVAAMTVTRPLGATTTFTHTVSGATSCTASSSPADSVWNATPISTAGGTYDVNPVIASVNGFTSYSIACTGPGGTMIKAIRVNVVTVQPTVTLSAASTSIPRGSATTLTWVVTNANTCVATSVPADGVWTGPVSRSGGSQPTGNIMAATTYTITCQSPSGTTVKSITVNVYDPPPAITLGASRNPMTPIDTSTTTWSVTGATSCTGTSIPSDGTWNGAKTTPSGSLVVAPDVTTTYTLTCTGPGGSATTDFTISVASTPPLIEMLLTDDTIVETNPTDFSWQVSGATSCTASSNPEDTSWDGVKNLIDSDTVSPLVTTTYSLYCEGPWGNLTQAKTVSVIEKAEIDEFEICVDIPGGECVTAGETLEVNPGTPLVVEWDSDDATFCSATGGGAQSNRFSTQGAISGSDTAMATPYPESEETYTIACGSAGILTSDYIFITVKTNPVIPSIWISPKVLQSNGGTTTVSWDTNNGDQSVCSLRGGGLSNADLGASGETGTKLNVTIMGRTSFVVTCGSQSATTTVELSPRIWGT